MCALGGPGGAPTQGFSKLNSPDAVGRSHSLSIEKPPLSIASAGDDMLTSCSLSIIRQECSLRSIANFSKPKQPFV